MKNKTSPFRSLVALLMVGLLAGGLSACGGGGDPVTGGGGGGNGGGGNGGGGNGGGGNGGGGNGGGGNGGGGNGGGGNVATPPENGLRSSFDETFEPSNPRNPTSWETNEYWNSSGLDLIDASEGYAIRTTGRPGGLGITVAVLDNGVDFSHPDIDAGQYDSELAFEGADLPRDHGTPVAGVIAARRDGYGVHGVAYAANIASVATCKASGGCAGDVLDVTHADETAADIASAAGLTRSYGNIDSNTGASSHIMNMSFGTRGGRIEVPQIISAMQDAASAGRIMVIALGNDEHLGPAGIPAWYVEDPGIAGWAIAVGALDTSGKRDALFSNTCNGVANYCLFAPGEQVYTTVDGGGYDYVDGTSFAAPHVAGAAAVAWAAFPNKDGAQIVDRLLTTARPLQGYYFSQYFGHGALDLGAALNPVGFLSVTTVGGSMAPLADSYVALPPGFSAPPQSKGLADTVVYDEQMFPFYYDLTASFLGSERRAEGMLREFLSSLGTSSAVSLDGTDVSLKFVHDDDLSNLRWDALNGDDQDKELDVYRFDFTPSPGLTVALGQGFGSMGSSNDFIGKRTQRTIFNDEFTVAPFAAFAGRGPGLTVDWQVDDETTIDLVGKSGQGYRGSASTQLASLGLTREIGDGVTLGARYGTLRERGSMMGIRAEGAFTNTGRATTDFVDVSVNGRVSSDFTVFGGMSHGITGGGTPASASTLVSEWGDAQAGSFVIGTEFEQLWQESDRLTLTASSPFRAERAMVHVEVPDREVADQVVSYTRRAIDLAPSGREHRLQVVYETKPTEGWLAFGMDAVSIALGSYVRMEPDHDETADPEFGAAAKIRASF